MYCATTPLYVFMLLSFLFFCSFCYFYYLCILNLFQKVQNDTCCSNCKSIHKLFCALTFMSCPFSLAVNPPCRITLIYPLRIYPHSLWVSKIVCATPSAMPGNQQTVDVCFLVAMKAHRDSTVSAGTQKRS